MRLGITMSTNGIKIEFLNIVDRLKEKKLDKYLIDKNVLEAFMNPFNEYKIKIEKASEKHETEEHFKGILNSFIKEVYKYDVNTSNNIDSAIRNDNDDINTIVEVKRPENKGEMIDDTNFNKKSLHEALLYYYFERNKNVSSINNIIITNCEVVYLFSANEFETIINIKSVKKLLDGYKDKTLEIVRTTKTVYDEISKLLDSEDINIKTSKINLFDENIEMVSFYKVFDKYHLFNKPLLNIDNNALDKDFYNELLYIMGLKETKDDKNIPIIKYQGYSNSLMYMTMIQLKENMHLKREECFQVLEGNDDERYENIALELVITWINRILFLKLLEAKLVNYHSDDKKDIYKFLDYSKVQNWQDLSTLFFEVLAVQIENRDDNNKKLEIPYLNSSLFEMTEYEQYAKIGSFNSENKIIIYEKTVLDNIKKDETQKTLKYLFDFLDAYNFQIGDKYVDSGKRLINSAVLGLIFERLNGYENGAVYTPGFITMSMSKDALRLVVISKFNTEFSWKCRSFKDIQNKILQNDDISLERYNEVFNSIRVCDPACGSGHFLVSCLNELLLIKYELKIFIDKFGVIISHCDMEILYDELFMKCNGDYFSYKVNGKNEPLSNELQRLQETLFHEKETLIENCLFGVDINPKSVYICQLRLWIELLKNTYYIQDDSPIINLQTLPNIDINIKTGNSLVHVIDRSKSIRWFLKGRITIKEYRNFIYEYQNTNNKDNKMDIIQKLKEVKDSINTSIYLENLKYQKYYDANQKLIHAENDYARGIIDDSDLDMINDLRKKVADAKVKYEKEKRFLARGLEWSYEFPQVLNNDEKFIGFDLVITNPPYFRYDTKTTGHIEQINYFKNDGLYSHACGGKINAYEVFLLLSHSICKENGFISAIFQNSFLADKASSGVRKYYMNNTKIIKINSFPERDSSKMRVFENVKMSVMTLLAQRGTVTEIIPLNIYSDRMESSPKHIDIKRSTIANIDEASMEIPNLNEKELSILEKCYDNTKILDIYAYVFEGELNLTFCKKYFTDDPQFTPFYVGANIQKYFITDTPSQRTVPEYFDREKYLTDNTGEKSGHYLKERIVYQGITGVNDKYRLLASIENNIFCGNTIDYLIMKKNTNSLFILGLMNSWLLNWIFKSRSTNAHTNTYEIKRLPIPEATPEQQAPVIELVKKCMEAKKLDNKADISNLQSEIDSLVYGLYGLSGDEIKIIEGRGL